MVHLVAIARELKFVLLCVFHRVAVVASAVLALASVALAAIQY